MEWNETLLSQSLVYSHCFSVITMSLLPPSSSIQASWHLDQIIVREISNAYENGGKRKRERREKAERRREERRVRGTAMANHSSVKSSLAVDYLTNRIQQAKQDLAKIEKKVKPKKKKPKKKNRLHD